MTHQTFTKLFLILIVSVTGCSPSADQEAKEVPTFEANNFILSAAIVGAENASDRVCPSGVQIEMNSNGVGSITWILKGEPGHHGCFHDPENATRNDKVKLDGRQLKKFKERINRIDWEGSFEGVESAWLAPHPDCDITHNGLPDTVISMENNERVISRGIFIYELGNNQKTLGGNEVSNNCKQAIAREADLVQEIIDMMPVNPPFPAKLYYRAKYSSHFEDNR